MMIASLLVITWNRSTKEELRIPFSVSKYLQKKFSPSTYTFNVREARGGEEEETEYQRSQPTHLEKTRPK